LRRIGQGAKLAFLIVRLIRKRGDDGRVEMWRGGGRVGLSVAAPFVWRCPSNRAIASVSTSRCIEPDVQFSRIRLSDKTSRFRPRRVTLQQARQVNHAQLVIQIRVEIGSAMWPRMIASFNTSNLLMSLEIVLFDGRNLRQIAKLPPLPSAVLVAEWRVSESFLNGTSPSIFVNLAIN
jgi:hypothetical protein